MTKLTKLPFFDVFTELRKAGFPLGIDDYLLLPKAFEAGFGLPDRAALQRLCQLLWVKSEDERAKFNSCFDKWQPSFSEEDVKKELPHPEPTFSEEPIPPPQKPEPKSSTPSEPPIDEPAKPVIEPTEPVAEPEPQPSGAMPGAYQVALHKRVEQWIKGKEYDYYLGENYLPMTERQIEQNWRYLRRPIRQGPPVELDVEATVAQIAEQGFLLKPVLVPRRLHRLKLVLLLDHDGSMMPFHPYLRRLKQTVLSDKRHQIYYFRNCPVGVLYNVKAQEPQDLEKVLLSFHASDTAMLIFSDAGAARGGFNSERIKDTLTFLQKLRQRVGRLVWLNPVPPERWANSSAEEIEQAVPMFYFDQAGMLAAINTLKG